MERLLNMDCDIKTVSVSALAFIGDSVYDMLSREYLVCTAHEKSGQLHGRAVKMVNAGAQAAAVEVILPLLSEEEETVLKRGRNSHSSRVPRNATVSHYRTATGLETLFGFLYLTGRLDRIRELFYIIVKENSSLRD